MSTTTTYRKKEKFEPLWT